MGSRSKRNRQNMPLENDETRKTELRSLNIGKPPEFDIHSEDWNIYEELLEQFFQVNAIGEDRKVSVLITCIGAEAYKYLRDLCIPNLPKNKTYPSLCDIMRCQFSRKLSLFRERSDFYNIKQTSDYKYKYYK